MVPDGFSIETLASIPGARVIVRDGFGNYWVSQPSLGQVSLIEMEGDTVRNAYPVLRNLRYPHGLAIDPSGSGYTLYVAEEDAITRVHLYSDAPLEHVADLPAGGLHRTRTIAFGPDGRLYVSIGSSCNVCNDGEERAVMLSMNTDGSDRRIVAKGLRNAVFFHWHPVTGAMLATEMGRDRLGDTLPPDELNVIHDGAHYGWPSCYADRVRDLSFGVDGAFDCASTVAPFMQLQAHVAPLGFAVLHGSAWPASVRDDLIVAEHGSWNSSVQVGYKLVRIPLDEQGTVTGDPVDFLTGFLDDGTVHGRPVDLYAEDDGDLLVTDDRRGVVYRMRAY